MLVSVIEVISKIATGGWAFRHADAHELQQIEQLIGELRREND